MTIYFSIDQHPDECNSLLGWRQDLIDNAGCLCIEALYEHRKVMIEGHPDSSEPDVNLYEIRKTTRSRESIDRLVIWEIC